MQSTGPFDCGLIENDWKTLQIQDIDSISKTDAIKVGIIGMQLTTTASLSSPDVLRALEANVAMIRFDRQRRVVDVNDLFAKAMKYKRDEMIGMHHHLFCTPSFVSSPDYQAFWNKLFDGFSSADKIERIDARGDSIWLEATYMPIYEQDEVVGVVKIASDITSRQ